MSRPPQIRNLQIDRQARGNALDLETLKWLVSALADAQSDPDTAAVILGGNGRNFCAGIDTGAIADAPQQTAEAMFDLLRAAATFEKPLIAKVQGAAAGAGWLLAACADSVVAAPGAIFSLPEVHAGIPAFAAIALLEPRLPRALFRKALFSGRGVSAEHLAECGFLQIGDARTAEAEAEALCEGATVFAPLMRHARAPLLLEVERARDASLAFLSGKQIHVRNQR